MFFSFVNIFIYLGHKHAKVKNLFCECKKYIIVNFGGLKVGYVLWKWMFKLHGHM